MASAVLVLTICLSGSCHDAHIQLDGISISGCVVTAQRSIADWIVEHPGYEVAKWRCEEPGEHEL